MVRFSDSIARQIQSLRVTVQFYSYRSAVIGSTRMARRAGM
jgi:hypothetical protein